MIWKCFLFYILRIKKRTFVKQFKGPHKCLNNSNIDNNPGKLPESLKEKKKHIFYDVALPPSCVLDIFPPMLCAENDSLQGLRNMKRRDSDLH